MKWDIIAILFAILILGIASVSRNSLQELKGKFSVLSRPECVDDLTYQASKDFSSSMVKASSITNLAVILALCLLGLPVADVFIINYIP